MKLIDSSVKEIIQAPGMNGLYEAIEYAGRICYASEPKGNPKEFVESLIKRGHLSPLEFGTLYLKTNNVVANYFVNNPYSRVIVLDGDENEEPEYLVTTNYRVLIEMRKPFLVEYMVDTPFAAHEKRRTFHFTLSEGIAREFCRHRANSCCQQSTRYCNFSKEKFGEEITFIKPYWYGADIKTEIFETNCKRVELEYMMLIENGAKAQEAREILPLSTKTELVQCAFESDWKHFIDLRCAAAAHPDAQKLANKIKTVLEKE